jgi:hypothetical protein
VVFYGSFEIYVSEKYATHVIYYSECLHAVFAIEFSHPPQQPFDEVAEILNSGRGNTNWKLVSP